MADHPQRPAQPIDDLVRAVRARVAVDERERRSQHEFVEYLGTLADPFDEHAGPVHVTGSAVVVGSLGVVLHLHKRLGRWLQPGGHLEPGETPWQAARREAVEETGLSVSFWAPGGRRVAPPPLLHVDVHPGPRGHTHLDARYLCWAPPEVPAPGEGESPEVRWFTWDDALAIADEGLFGALVAARALLAAAGEPV